MKIFKNSKVSMMLLLIVITGFACGGDSSSQGIDLPGETTSTSEECDGDVCTSISTSTAGNFDLGYIEVTEDGTENMPIDVPSVSVGNDGEKLTITCEDESTTKNALVVFSCNLGDYSNYFALCIHGDMAFFSEDDTDIFSTGCASLSFYCDQYGFNSDTQCVANVDTLVTDDAEEYSLDEFVSEDILNYIGL